MSLSSHSLEAEDEGAKKKKRRSSFMPGRRSLITDVVSDSESDDSTNDSLNKDKMLTGLLHEIIAEHKQEQADWNNYIKREKKQTEEFLSQGDLVATFSDADIDRLPAAYRDAIAKSRAAVTHERDALGQLRGRARSAEEEMDKVMEGVEALAARQRRRVDEALETRRKMRGDEEAKEASRNCIETLLMSDDSGIGADCTNNNETVGGGGGGGGRKK